MPFVKQQTSNTNNSSSDLDWKALVEEEKKVVGVTPANGKPVIGVVAGIVDCGFQPRPDFEEELDEAAAMEAKNKDPENVSVSPLPNGKFKVARKQQPAQSIAIAIDLPSLMVNYGVVKGETNVRPYRIWLSGERFDKVERRMFTNKLVALKAAPPKKGSTLWTYHPKNTVAAIAATQSPDKYNEILNNFPDPTGLLGCFCQFTLKTSVGGDEGQYFNKGLSVPSTIMEGIPLPEYNLEPFCIDFNGANDPSILFNIPNAVKNQLTLAQEARDRKGNVLSPCWEDSLLKQQLEAPAVNEPAPQQQAPQTSQEHVDFDDSVPF